MAYSKTTWQTGDVIGASGLNNMESGIEAANVMGANIAAVYDPTADYAVGAYCLYNNILYQCTTAITGGEEWNAEHWTAIKIMGEIPAVPSPTVLVTVTSGDDSYTVDKTAAELSAAFEIGQLILCLLDNVIMMPVSYGTPDDTAISKNLFSVTYGSTTQYALTVDTSDSSVTFAAVE